MKRLFSIFTVALLSLAIVSCSKEESMPETGGSADVLTFTFEGLNYGPISYAIATTPENTVNELDIYMFESATGAFLKKWNWQDGVANAEATITTVNLTQTLKLTGAEGFGVTDKVFYFVANPGSTTTLSTSSESAFKEQLTDELSYGTDGYKSPVAPLLFTGKTGAINPISGTTSTVQMRRRVARFDIVNEYENLTIEKVFISGANLYGYAFGNATGVNASGITADKYEVLAGPSAYESINSERIAQSVFYLYPTTVNAYGANKKTEIALQVKQAGATASEIVYVTAENYSVLANYRYKLVISESVGDNSFKLSLVYEDWTEGGSTEVDREDIGVTMSDLSWAGGDYDFTSNAGGTLTFTVTSASGTTPQFIYTRGNASDLSVAPAVANKTSVITYAAKTVETYEVTIPEYSTQTDFMDIQMTLVNRANPNNNESFSFITTSLAITPALFPDAVFRQYVSDEFDGDGNGFLTLAEATAATSIDLDNTNVTSIQGIKIFSALEELFVETTSNLTSIDVSGLTVLKTVKMQETGAVEADFSGCSSLEILYMNGSTTETGTINLTGCTSLREFIADEVPNLSQIINLEDCVNLEEIDVQNTPLVYIYDLNKFPNLKILLVQRTQASVVWGQSENLTTIAVVECGLSVVDVTGYPNLKALEMDENNVRFLDLSNNPLLERLWCNDNNLSSLDLSNNNALTYVNAQDNPITGDIYVTSTVYNKATVTNVASFRKPATAEWAVKP